MADTPLQPLLDPFRIDFDPPVEQPSWARWALASFVAIAGSLAADAAIVAIAIAVYPHLKDYAHFQFVDYSKLTVIGVIIACIGWPVTTRVSSSPRWLFRLAAIVVTLVLFLPDLWIWWQGQSTTAVLILMVMHVAIALVTYFALVLIAPAGPDRAR